MAVGNENNLCAALQQRIGRQRRYRGTLRFWRNHRSKTRPIIRAERSGRNPHHPVLKQEYRRMHIVHLQVRPVDALSHQQYKIWLLSSEVRHVDKVAEPVHGARLAATLGKRLQQRGLFQNLSVSTQHQRLKQIGAPKNTGTAAIPHGRNVAFRG